VSYNVLSQLQLRFNTWCCYTKWSSGH